MGIGVGAAKGGQPRAGSGLSFSDLRLPVTNPSQRPARGQFEHFGQLRVSRSLPFNRGRPIAPR